MPIISIWTLVVSLIVLALGLVYKVVEKSHALKLADKETDRLRSRIEVLEEARKNESLSVGPEIKSLNSINNNGISKSNKNVRDTKNKEANDPSHKTHTTTPLATLRDQKKVISGISSLSEALSLESILGTINDDKTTPLQKSLFVERNSGSRITWCGHVETIQKLWESDEDSDILIILSPIDDPEKKFKNATAVFPSTEAQILAQASQGNHIFIEGTLNFSELAGNWSASLKDSKLIRVEESAQQIT